MGDCVAIVSGGMDSVTLLHWLVKVERRKPAVLSFIYGQKHSREIACARENAQLLDCAEHVIVDISSMRDLFRTSALVATEIAVPTIDHVRGDPQPLTYVPNRNMIFLSLAVAYAESHGASEVYYGAQHHDLYGYWDTTIEFLERINAVLALNRKVPVAILAPFVNAGKADILRKGLDIGVDYAKTWSCYEGSDLACGKCPTCAERLAAFHALGEIDPMGYQPS